MAYDFGICYAITYELQNIIIKSRIEKIYQPTKDSIVFSLRTNYSDGKTQKIIIDAGPYSRVSLTSQSFENPLQPPTFCMLLRKKLSGASIDTVEQINYDRIIKFTFSGYDELGFKTSYFIYAEMLGKYSNIIFCNSDNIVLYATHVSDISSNEKRPIYQGAIYTFPPISVEKNNPFIHENNFSDEIVVKDYKDLISTYVGFSPLTAREILFRSSERSVKYELQMYFDHLKRNSFTPTVLYDKSGFPYDFSFVDINQFGALYTKKHYDSVNDAVDSFYSDKTVRTILLAKSSDLYKLINNHINRLNTKIEKQSEELDDYSRKDLYKRYADAISANIYLLKKGMSSAVLTDYASDDLREITVELDRRLTPSQNINKYYKLYDKCRSGEEKLNEQIERSKEEIIYLQTVISSLDNAESVADIEDIRDELIAQKYIKNASKDKKGKIKSKPLQFITENGFTVLCGKNNYQNDMITFKLSEKNDIWFHINGYPGSHVVMLCSGKEPSESDYTAAATIAATYSSVKGTGKVKVDYTRIKNIKKPPSSRPGFVTFSSNYSTYVYSDKNAVENLLSDKKNN